MTALPTKTPLLVESGGAEITREIAMKENPSLGFFFDLGFYFGGYVAKDFYGDGVFA